MSRTAPDDSLWNLTTLSGSGLALDLDPAGARGALDDPGARLRRSGVEVVHLDLHDLHHLGLRDLARGLAPGVGRALGELGRLLQEDARRRRLHDEVEGLVLEHGDDDGEHHARLVLGAVVEPLHELADVHAVLAEGDRKSTRLNSSHMSISYA